MRPFLTLHHPAAASRYYSEGAWLKDTFYSLMCGHAEQRPDALALNDGRHRLTWRQLADWVDGVAADFHRQGIHSGDRVSLWLGNRAEAVVAFLACARNGVACNPSLHRTYTSTDIVQLLDRLQAKALLTETGWGADTPATDTMSALKGASSLLCIYTPEDFPQPGPADLPPVEDPDKVVYLAFTSGTTGLPKCVMHSDNTLLANARDLVRDWQHGPDTKLLSLSPLSHHIAWVAVAQWLIAGCVLITDNPPAGKSRLDWIIETGATYVMGVPTHAMDILAEQQRRGIERLGAVNLFYMAGSPIPPSVCEAFVRQGIKPQNIYGMTENSSHQYTHPADHNEVIISTCGRGGKAYEIRLFDPADADREVPVGTVGQIAGRGAALMLGYFANQTATEGSFNRDGWFLSGDLGVIDEMGNLRIEGRLKDLIIRGGHNIYPVHIEALALRHPSVERVACYPIADERLGERVCIAVIGDIEAYDLLRHLAEQGLSKYDMPEFFLRVSQFPLTPSGKILKRDLIEMTKRGELVPTAVRWTDPGSQARTG
ncbi:class I adenylate-forming enzyme family protein [Pseudorhodoplanes sp.]|uniref:class I adenylate-forming enzyme family protein n=1 Tax=Pseudorhodoplanes sp. TaxID=1934341 RepID=UPI002BC8B374|nr:class I adenylate-forming enzyme family protein [Pseudorhodoplanes sp.]HWV55421.1 class I adenylate-forming enzyme family protein [Pseudorhodoplanes sp.]